MARLGGLAAEPLAPVSVLVTHHVEEVPVGVTHALLIARGRVVASGPVDEVLRDGPLSESFGLALSVHRWAGRWSARALRPLVEWGAWSAWVWWVVAALGLAVIEIATLDLIFIMLAAGAAGRRRDGRAGRPGRPPGHRGRGRRRSPCWAWSGRSR